MKAVRWREFSINIFGRVLPVNIVSRQTLINLIKVVYTFLEHLSLLITTVGGWGLLM